MSKRIVPTITGAFSKAPGFFPPCRLWLYGNIRLLLQNLAYVPLALVGPGHTPQELEKVGEDAREIVFNGQILVCGIHNYAHQRSAIVPLRYGSPRIVVFSGGFRSHLGDDLMNEPFKAAQQWRRYWDPMTDLAVSLRAPSSLPTYGHRNPTVDRLVAELAEGKLDGLCGVYNPYPPILRE